MESEDSVFDLIKEYRSEFSELLKSALKDGLAKVADAVSSKKHIATYHEWPLIHYKKMDYLVYHPLVILGRKSIKDSLAL